ncbi:hypothetical protein BS50DRAFT_573986 [Corynespora cassiicola Philippines]|uniref:Uncharacterized protein n=1 Tax=Corynespora cassiicola Philippines TaxID=1448308 RepID=A0A2T2NP88_CORCC|nr:hypothetical protein BS50DRAFT_573986 [Corynespora cassiicola Philippines]
MDHPTPRLTNRLSALRTLLQDLNESADIRDLLIDKARRSPEYAMHLPRNMKWRDKAQADDRLIRVLTQKVEAAGASVDAELLVQWERMAQRLRENTLNANDVVAEQRVWHRFKVEPEMFVEGWSFEGAEEKAKEEEGRGGVGDKVKGKVDPHERNMNPHDDAGQYGELYNRIAKVPGEYLP